PPIHALGDQPLEVVQAHARARLRIAHVEILDPALFGGRGLQIRPDSRRAHHPPRLSSVSTSLATALSVSNTPTPVVATASNSGTLVGLRTFFSSSIGAEFGRSRLLYCTQYGILSRL